MDELICYDLYGNPLEFLTQWDQNQVIVVKGVDLSPTIAVRFANQASKVSLVVKPTIVGRSLRIDVPNILLTQSLPITFYINYEYDDGYIKTMHVLHLPVIPCKRPEDYEMYQNVDYVSWVELAEIASDIIATLENERVVFFVGNTEPEENDVLWFDTSEG